jgi:hypothetical protein
MTVLNVRSLVNIVLDSTSTTYASWRNLMMMVLERYALLDHVNSDVASSTDPGWRRMDSVVLNWISTSTPLPPPAPTPRFPPPDRPTSTRGRGTSPCTPVRFRAVSSARRP